MQAQPLESYNQGARALLDQKGLLKGKHSTTSDAKLCSINEPKC